MSTSQCTSEEVWVPLTSSPGYDVSSTGRVRSWRPCRSEAIPRILKQGARGEDRGTSYFRVRIRMASGAFKARPVHHLVAEAFLGPRPPGAQIRHLDGNSLNNAAANLAYGTAAENIADMMRHGTHGQASKTHCKRGHEFTPENTFLRPEGHRVCRKCREITHPRRARKLAKDATACPICGFPRSRNAMSRHVRIMHSAEVAS